MPFQHRDFNLSDAQMASLNQYIDARARQYVDTGEDPPSGIEIRFVWTPGLGRSVTVYFDGAMDGYPLEDALGLG